MKINTRWIRDLNARPETMKLLVENIVSRLSDISLGNFFFFLDLSPQVKETKAKVNKWGYPELKSYFTEKETINKT